ncbi:thioredoxin-like protein [Hyaloraphidium curvatum]|nr:thioredoxin-like protein [Hyaloraphidium curvatum]
MVELKVGDTVPDFELQDQDGKAVKLSDFKGRPLVVFFYPKANTFGCTREACSFRDNIGLFPAGTAVVGVSSDTPEAQRAFADAYNLGFPLLADVGGALRAKWGVPNSMMGLTPGRVTYVIDKDFVVRSIYNSGMAYWAHVTEAAKAVKALA